MALINELTGSLGKYQLWLCSIIFLNKFGVAFHQMAIIFLAPPVQYSCEGRNASCCDNPVYNKTKFTRTIVMEWNLICERSWLKDLNQTIFQFGVLSGSLLCGVASDRFGRRKTLIICIIMEVFTGLATSFLPTYWSFTILRMFLGFSVGGVMVVGFVMVMEYVGYEYRDVISALFHVPFTAGYILLALFGYLIRDYVYFQFGISLANSFLLMYICILPESPRWLLAVDRTIEAVALLEHIAEVNGLPVHEIQDKINLYQLNSNVNHKKTFAWDLFRTPNLRKNIILMSFMWLINSYYFYGVSHYICHLTGDLYINVVSTGGVCLCSCIVAIPVIRFMTRKTVVIASFIVCSSCMLTVCIVPGGSFAVALGCIGLSFSFIVIIVAYLFCSEMFPTVVRNGAMGMASMMARLGAMIAPFVIALKPHGEWCAPVAFGIFPLIAAGLCHWLPETKGCDLMTTLEEGEAFGRKTRTENIPTGSTEQGTTFYL